MIETTQDAFLGGRLKIEQPKIGYRGATDPVYLAASIPAKSGQSVLELGCGVGIAALCLGVRIEDLTITGIEIQSDYVKLARANANSNSIDFNIVDGSIKEMPAELRNQSFDHVFTNPPFFDSETVDAPTSEGKAIAHVEAVSLKDWIEIGIKRLLPKGSFTIIHQAERLGEILSAMEGPCGDISILPIAPRAGRAANRVIIQGRKTSKGKSKLLPPLIIHDGSQHIKDGSYFTSIADGILRNGLPISL